MPLLPGPARREFFQIRVGATIYRALGVDPGSEIRDAQNRPSRVCAGKPMDVLFQNR